MGYQGSTGFHPAITGGGGGGFYQIVQDEGVALPQQIILDFQGAGVTVTNGVGKTIVTIPGGGGGAPSGPAGGDLNGNYPNPGVTWANGYPTYDLRYLQIGAVAGGDLGGTYPNPSVTWANGYPTYDLRYPQLSGAYIDPTWIATLDWGKITGAPSSFPPSGAAGGDLSGNYPNPSVTWSNGYTTYDARYPQLSGSYSNPTWINTLAYSKITGAPSSLPPSGGAGGELSGTYPNPSLVNSAVIGKVLTGFVSSPGTVAATDSILQAIQKLDGNINNVNLASGRLFNYYNFI